MKDKSIIEEIKTEPKLRRRLASMGIVPRRKVRLSPEEENSMIAVEKISNLTFHNLIKRTNAKNGELKDKIERPHE